MTTLLTYAPADVILQLEILTAQNPKHFKIATIAEKEQLIQSGQAHYSDFIQPETPPSEIQMAIYRESLARYRHKIAQGIIALSDHILRQPESQKQPQIVLLSLIRAGLPLGVLLKRHLARQRPVHHYGISIIKDKGLDRAALETIFSRHPQAAYYCIDGWIGKGAITANLRQSWQQHAAHIPMQLLTLSDPTCDLSDYSPYGGDWLIPFGILGSPISGFISRTLYQAYPQPHASYYYDQIAQHYTPATAPFNHFIAQIEQEIPRATAPNLSHEHKIPHRQLLAQLAQIQRQHHIADLNRFKPSIAEATRAILRRQPEKVLIAPRNETPDLRLIKTLCAERHIPLIHEPLLDNTPYQVMTIIR